VASSNKFLAIDLGSSTLKLGIFQYAQGSLTLLDYAIREMGLDPNKEQDRFPFIAETLQALLQEKGITKPEKAYCSISGQFVFTRFVKLPPVAAEQIDQMVVFEAQQNVPFPINEVVWDYQLLGGKGSKEAEAVIVAVKSDLVEQAGAALQMHKLDLDKVDVAPLTLVNAFRYSYPEITDCVLIIDIGAKSTNLVFVEGGKIFCRVIPIGGHMISQNISNEFQEPYVAAELLKKGKGFVGLGGAYADPEDQSAARISKIARSVFSRLHAEISRSISFYRNQQNGMPPKLILLAGGAAAMPYADLFFKEKLNIPVEFFNPLKNVGIAPSLDRNKLGTDAYLLGAVTGLGLRVLEDAPIEVNLVPLSAQQKQKKKGQMPYLVGAILAWALLFAVAAGVNFWKLQEVSAVVEEMQGDLSNKQKLASAIEKSAKEVGQDKRKLLGLQRLVEQRDFWPELMNQLITSVSNYSGLWISQVDLTYNGNPVETIPANLAAPTPPPASTGKQRASRAAAAQAQAAPQALDPSKLNLAPKASELNIRGFYEAAMPFDMLNQFTEDLKKTGLFENVEIISRESSNNDQVALQFFVRAVFKADKQPDLMP
jgi:type IV pilus assembly protein PilM